MVFNPRNHYDWHIWADGDTHDIDLRKFTHDVTPSQFRPVMTMWAKRHGLAYASRMIDEYTIRIQFKPPAEAYDWDV